MPNQQALQYLRTVGALVVAALWLSACTTTSEPVARVQTQAAPAEDGEWVMNVRGQPHTHRVNLPGCPEVKTITHVHQADQADVGLHQHRGCLVCPPKHGVKRILE